MCIVQRGRIDEPDEDAFRLAKTVPSGSYVVEAGLDAQALRESLTPILNCFLLRGGELPNFETSVVRILRLSEADQVSSAGSLVLQAAFDHPGGEIALQCFDNSIDSDKHIAFIQATLLVTKVATVG